MNSEEEKQDRGRCHLLGLEGKDALAILVKPLSRYDNF